MKKNVLCRYACVTALFVAAVGTQSPAAAGPAGPPASPNVEFVEESGGISHYRLKSNGMNLFLSQNRSAPVITFMVVYHVGSRNEAPGNTGSAHLLEHMIFNKSTENFGKANGHKTFQEVLYEAGANYGSTNMTTSYDRMNGYSTLPSDKLELAMRIEADRLGRGLILDEERKSEMSVVRNEFEIGENNPGGVLFKMVIATAIQAHPYHWSTIGYRSDIEGVTTEKLREHYRNFFRPDNADAILVGDFDRDAALSMFDAQFGGFRNPTTAIPQVITQEPPQEGERRVMVERPGKVKIVEMVYMRPGSLHPDFIPLTVLSDIVGSGVNSRLYRSVVESGLATDVSSWNGAFKDPYVFEVDATVAPGSTHQQVEDSMKAVLYRVGREGVTKDELEKAKERIIFDVVRRRDGTYQYASSLGEAIASADWKWFLGYVDAVKAVTTSDIQRVAARYLIPEHATVGWFVPLASAPSAEAREIAVDSSVNSASSVASHSAAPPNEQAAMQSSFAQRTVRRILPNGTTLDIVENHTVPVVSIEGAFIGGESLTRATQPALGELTAHMMERGTTSRSKEEIANLLDGAGASISFGADSYASTVSASLPAAALQLVLDVMSDEILHPAFTPDELEKAKASMKSDVLRGAESTSSRGFERLTQIAFPDDYPYRAPGSERMLKSIDSVQAQDISVFHSTSYNGKSFILSIVGDVDAEATAKMIEKMFSDLEPGIRPVLSYERVQPVSAAREVVTMPGKANMNLYYGLASGLRRADPDYEAALVANAALGQSGVASRLGRRVRDAEGLTYSIYSRFTLCDALDGVWFASVNVAPMNLQKAMKSTSEEIRRFCRDGITAEELEIQKNYFAGNYQVSLGTNAGVAGALVTAERYGFGPSYLDDYPSRMRKVTLEQANEAIKKHINADHLITVVAGDLEKLPD